MDLNKKIEPVNVVANEELEEENGQTRRDFMVMAATGIACVGAVAAGIPFIRSLSPSADVLAVGAVEVDLTKINEGDTITVLWRGYPIFVRHRTKQEVEEAQNANLTDLKDPEADDKRVKKGKEQWLVVFASCTHLGCIPLAKRGEYSGWLCPCHGSVYDTSGRIRKGPAPLNLPVPPYEFLSDTKIKIG